MLKKFRNPVIFALVILPIGLIGGFFTSVYLAETSPADLSVALQQLGSDNPLLLHIITAVQAGLQAAVMAFLGYILSEKCGLMKSFKLSKKDLIYSLVLIFIVLEYGWFSNVIPEIAAMYEQKPTISYMISCLTYGGIIEEVMMRLFLMTLIVFIVWKLFLKKHDTVPTGLLIAANFVAAILFAAGHLPTTAMTMELTPLILIRCFLLNSYAGLIFGHLYMKKGIQYAMLAHAGFHILWKIFWILFV